MIQTIKKTTLTLGIALFLVSGIGSNLSATSKGVTGCWRTISDKDGKVKSKICLWKSKNGKLYGKITKLYNPSEPNPKCTKCKGKRKNKPVIGMVIVSGLKDEGDAWEDGKILDPNNGKWYTCKIWKSGSKLKVRGYIGFLYRTQTWIK
ncbi:MAG: DUF2147 domain-containing protein [Spirochaetota bacterium]